MQKRGILAILLVILGSSVLALTGDFDDSGCVDFDDFLKFARAFENFQENKFMDLTFNLDGNDKIDIQDFLIFAENYGKCEESMEIGENRKNGDLYREKQIFLISDKNWQDVLQLVSLTTWTVSEGHPDLEWCNVLKNEDGSTRVFNEKDEYGDDVINYVCGYPTLIYHEEETGFDADSIIHFIQQYSPDGFFVNDNVPRELSNLLITESELGGGLRSEDGIQILTYLYPAFWGTYHEVVYVEDNYELSLIASSYASLINAPLIIENGEIDQDIYLKDKKIVCIGNIGRMDCSEDYNLEELQRKYIELTNTNKVILVNPNDLDIKIEEDFQPEKSSNSIKEIYSKTSLGAPILAGGKHEIMIFTNSKFYEHVNSVIDLNIGTLELSPNYLTIIASPNTIEMSKEYDYYGTKRQQEVDNHIYGNLDNDPFQELSVGRIFSLTTSDVSSHLARNLFYSEYLHPQDFSLLYPYPSDPGHNFINMKPPLHSVEAIFKNLGFNSVSFLEVGEYRNMDVKELENKRLIAYADHAGMSGGVGIFNSYFMNLENVWLSSPMILMEGCSSCGFERAYDKSELFCANLIRRGAIFHSGATVDNSATEGDVSKMFIEGLFGGKDIGISTKNFRNKLSMNGISRNLDPYDKWNVLIGDPTFNPYFEDYGLGDDKIVIDSYWEEEDFVLEINLPKLEKSIFMDYKFRDKNIHVELFENPLGDSLLRFYRGVTNELEGQSLEVVGLSFIVDFPIEYNLNKIKKVEYIDNSKIINIESMPVFESRRNPETEFAFDFIDYARDEGSNDLYFIFKEWIGKETVRNQKILGPYKYKIYFEVNTNEKVN